MTELIEQIKVVAEARVRAERALIDKLAALEVWEMENKALLEGAQEAHSQVAEAEANLRELTIKAYQETGNKAPAPGVGIREVTKLEYDPKNALMWAVEHRLALQLNKTAFEKIAKTDTPEFVTVHTEPQATIATDLSEVLKEN